MENKYENCPECGSPFLTYHNDLDREYWIDCEDCEFYEDITKEEYDKE